MVWVYFDESGEHHADGRLKKLTLGGSLATREVWDRLSDRWNCVLKEYGIDFFHMADFEANQEQFKGWDKTPERHRSLLKSLLDLCCEHIHFHVGLTVNHPDGSPFISTYKHHVVDSIAMARSKIATMDRSPFSLVYAKHPQFSLSKLEQVFQDVGQNDPRVKSCTTACPIGVPPLQVADIVAYEISRRYRQDLHRRYPWDRLLSNAGILFFSDEAFVPVWEGELPS